MAKKKKAAKPSKAKASAKKRVKKVAKKVGRKPSAKKRAAKKSPATTKVLAPPGALIVQMPPALEERVRALAERMSVPLDQLLVMALGEFTEAWEDHMQTVRALNEGDDRVQLAVPKEPA
jgi:predicted DNA-binding protein